MKPYSMAWLAACGTLAGGQAFAGDADLGTLRAEIAQMKQQYEQRIAALEKRLAETETNKPDPSATPLAPVRAGEAKAGAFNPEIGLVLQGRARKMKDVEERAVSGFWPGGHEHGSEPRGFSLEHSELMLAANIDQTFRGVARFAVTPENEVEVEEASVSTLGLGYGLNVRAGRFASGLGYQNAQHGHEWDFADASLMQKVLFGEEGYRQDGIQLKWVAPTPFFLQFGAETGRGSGFPGTDRNKNGAGSGVLFVKVGDDVGVSHAWQGGLSYLRTRAKSREAHFADVDGNEVEGLFSGRSRTLIGELIWKWAPNGDASERNFKFQSEVFRRTERGNLSCDDETATSATCAQSDLGALRTRQSGGYAQMVYQFMPRWRTGYRYDWLDSGRQAYDRAVVGAALDVEQGTLARYRPRRHSVMVDWSNSEFSRLRLQYARDRSMQGVTDNQWTLQYIMSLGAHGAHAF